MLEQQSHTEVVGASIELCFDTIVDFEAYPEWFSGITEAQIIERDDARGLWTVGYSLDMMIKTLRYTLAYESERPNRLTWKLTQGDVSDVQGSYEFVALESDVTEATCTQGIDVGFWIPGPLRRTFERSALSDSVGEFKKMAEARA